MEVDHNTIIVGGRMETELADRIKKLSILKKEGDELTERLKEINKAIDVLVKRDIPQLMEDSGINRVEINGVGRVDLRGDLYVSVLKSDQEEFYNWLRNTNRGSLITETVNSSTLKAAAKGWLTSGEDLPPILKIQPYTKAVLTSQKEISI